MVAQLQITKIDTHMAFTIKLPILAQSWENKSTFQYLVGRKTTN